MVVYTVEVLRKVVDGLVSQLHTEVAQLRHSARKDKECVAITGLVAACEKAICDIDATSRAFCQEGASIATSARGIRPNLGNDLPRQTIGSQSGNVITLCERVARQEHSFDREWRVHLSQCHQCREASAYIAWHPITP
jgi:hypothetical protein